MVTKGCDWRPCCLEGGKNGRQEVQLAPVQPQGREGWSPRKAIGARSAAIEGRMVTKEGYWRPFSCEGGKNGHQGVLLEPVQPQGREGWSPRGAVGARSAAREGRMVTKEGDWRPFSPNEEENGHQEELLKPAPIPRKEEWSPILPSLKPSARIIPQLIPFYKKISPRRSNFGKGSYKW